MMKKTKKEDEKAGGRKANKELEKKRKDLKEGGKKANATLRKEKK